MGTIKCEHCGKEIFDGLYECPECHGPIAQNINATIEELVATRNKKEIKNLIISLIIGLLVAVLATRQVYIFDEGAELILDVVITALLFMPGAYGVSVIFRKLIGGIFAAFFLLPVVGWLFLGFTAIVVGAFAGLVLTPIAIIKIIMKKPLVSREKVIKEINRA